MLTIIQAGVYKTLYRTMWMITLYHLFTLGMYTLKINKQLIYNLRKCTTIDITQLVIIVYSQNTKYNNTTTDRSPNLEKCSVIDTNNLLLFVL